MNISDWIILGCMWLLIPITLFIKYKQNERFKRYRAEDQKLFAEFVKGLLAKKPEEK